MKRSLLAWWESRSHRTHLAFTWLIAPLVLPFLAVLAVAMVGSELWGVFVSHHPAYDGAPACGCLRCARRRNNRDLYP